MHRRVAIAIAVVLVAGTITGVAMGRPPRPGSDDNGLTENESATLWSRDNDSQYITNADYRQAYGENRTGVQQVANGTDLTFKRPPATTATWTRNDHGEFTGGNESTSLYPPNANLTDGVSIVDAHATVFAVTPGTKTHSTPNDTQFYVAPNGTLRGVVDYRIRTAASTGGTNGTAGGQVQSHRISEVRLIADGKTVARANGSKRPALNYTVDSDVEHLRLEADIQVTVTLPSSAVDDTALSSNNTTGETTINRGSDVTVITEEVTVTDTVSVTPYTPRATLRYAAYPNGDVGVAIYKNQPWQGFALSDEDDRRVRGVWRFYTARNPRWDQLTRATANGTDQVRSPSIPVAVHAYPSKLGPRVEPTGNGPKLLRLWGTEHTTPAATLPENVSVEVVTNRYETSYGLAVRTRQLDRDELVMHGIVRGVNGTLVEPEGGSRRQLRRSNLTLSVINHSEDGAQLRVMLRDAKTGHPITLADQKRRYDAVASDSRSGYVTVAGQRVTTNVSGMATVHVATAGSYTARYHPDSWLTQDPAYTASTATARWHPLATVDGWLSLLTTGLMVAIPFLTAIYAGQRLGDLFKYRS